MYAIRNRNDPRIFFHYPDSGGRKKMTQIDKFQSGKIPRLFEQEWFANSALNTWLAGKIVSIPVDDEFSRLQIIPVPERKREDWEIVPVKIVVGETGQPQ